MDINQIPHHIAIIMDGNGRWAKLQGKERCYGHQAGAETVQAIIEAAGELGVKYLTLYTFSTENWDRPSDEVTALMTLLVDSLNLDSFIKNNIRLRVIGEVEMFPENVQKRLTECVDATAENTALCLTLALSYSSRWELTEAVKSIARKVKDEQINPEQINSQHIDEALATHFMPEPDLLIRTGGEKRLSNFLLWQCAYTELYFCDTFWPDFTVEELHKAIEEYQHRERRFGKTSEQLTVKEIKPQK